jgi:zinc protease
MVLQELKNKKHLNIWRRLTAAAVVPGLLLCALAMPAWSRNVQNSAPAAQASAVGDESLKLVTEFEVNGLKVLLKQRKASQTVVCGLFLRGGSRNITAENAGVEALMLDVATEASVNYPRDRFRRELSRTGTQISYGINYDYSALTLGSTRRYFDSAWAVFSDAVLHPSFAPDDFQRVKNRMLVSLSGERDTPDSYLQVLQSKIAYAGHPYLNDPHGTTESVSRLTVDDVKRYHQQMMQTSRMLLVIVGDLDPAQLQRKIESSFGKLPRGEYKPAPISQLTFSDSTVAVTPLTLPTNYVSGVWAAPPLNSADIYPMRVASAMLAQRVFEEVRTRRNLSYAPDAFLSSQGANTGGLYVTAVDANQAVQVMLYEVGRLQRGKTLKAGPDGPIEAAIDQDDIKARVARYLTNYYLGQETNAAQAGDLAQAELLGGGWRSSGEYINRLRAVTPADIQRVAQKYMRNIQFVVLGDPKAVNANIFTGKTEAKF